jgi:ferredoxin
MLSVLERLADQVDLTLQLDPERCVHAADVFTTCRACADICPTGALTVERGVDLRTETCTLCGACVHTCPVGAFAIQDSASGLLRCVARIKEHQAIELVCPLHPAPERGVRPVDAAIITASCLAALGPSTYAGLFALGVEQIDVQLDACDACPVGARTAVETTLRKARLALKPWVSTDQIAGITEPVDAGVYTHPVLQASQPPVSRRRLFNPFAGAEDEKLLDALVGEDMVQAKKRPSTERQRLLRALKWLPVPNQALCPASLAGQAFMQLGVKEGCNACGGCAKACPTGALSLEINDDHHTYRLAHTPASCVGCGVCIDLCEVGVLYSRGVPFFATLQAGERESISAGRFECCERCGTHLSEGAADETGLCELCAFRRKNPFGSRIPERMRPRFDRKSGAILPSGPARD